MAKQTIKLKLYQNIINEYIAAGAITPGMLITVGALGTVSVHASAGGVCEKMFALENELEGQTIDDAYAALDPVQTAIVNAGSEVLAWLADGEDVAIGEVLVSNGDGKLKAATADSSAVVIEEFPIAVAKEAIDMSGSSGADPSGRISVRIL